MRRIKITKAHRIFIFVMLGFVAEVVSAALPVITANVSGTTGQNGWYTSDVTLTWSVTGSGSISKSGCTVSTVTSDTGPSGSSFTCTARNYSGRTSKTVVIKRDTTPPTISVTTPASNSSFSQNQVLTSVFSCADTASGVKSCTGPSTVDTASSGSKTFVVTALDAAGLQNSKTVSYSVNAAVDTTPPVITATCNGSACNSNSWYGNPVSLVWTVTDPESPISSTDGCVNSNIAKDAPMQDYTCKATSAGGVFSLKVSFGVDITAPSVNIITPGKATYTQGSSLKVSYSCSDTGSGIKSCVGPVANGSNITLSSLGNSISFAVTATDNAGRTFTATSTYNVEADVVEAPGTRLLAWNDLGMHCADKDFSVFSLLPLFNTVNSQLIVGGKLVNGASGYSLAYKAFPDPTGSINSTGVGKSNFWDNTVQLFGMSLLPDQGLLGTRTPSNDPAPMAWNGTNKWFEAVGMPITSTDDSGKTNSFPLVRVMALDSTGKQVATSNPVAPISSEIQCVQCHGSSSGRSDALPKGTAPNAGPVNLTDVEKDWRFNVLRLHDQLNLGNPIYVGLLSKKSYGASLESSAQGGRPVLCDTCHNSNALATWFPGESTVSEMTVAMHRRHASVAPPTGVSSAATMDADSTRNTCYTCHPGKDTECLRGAMGNPKDASGNHLMECQSCHGKMSTVATTAALKTRTPWASEPNCQACHHDGLRETTAIDANSGAFRTSTDTRFATNSNMLYRFSSGHGGVQCEGCHNSTHAEFTNKPSDNNNQVNDNLRPIKAQGYAAALRECSTCHATTPQTTTGGPHGMHDIGASWVSRHHDQVGESSTVPTACATCHGSNSAGSALAVIKTPKTFTIEGRTKTFAVDEKVTCWSCHNGPNP